MAETNIQRLNYQIAPASKRNHLTDAKYIQGGYIAVKDLAELKTLPIVEYNEDGSIKKDGVIVKGSMAYAWDENRIYIYEAPPLSSIPEWIWKDFGGGAGGTYSTTVPTNVAVGGIPSGTTITDATMTDMFDFLLHKAVDPVFNSLVTAPTVAGTYEYGTTCSVTKIVPTYTSGTLRDGSPSPITNISAKDQAGTILLANTAVAASGTAMTLDKAVSLDGTSNLTITATLYDSCTPTPHTITKSSAIAFQKYNYYKVSTDPAYVADKGTVAKGATTKYDQTKSSGQVKITTTANSYVYFFTPVKVTTLQQYDSNEYINITTNQLGTVTITLDSGKAVTYYACRTNRLNAANLVFRAYTG